MTKIRCAQPEDAARASELAWRAKASWGYPLEWLELWRAVLTITPEYLRAHESLVAVEGNQIVGVCVLESRGADGLLEHVWIDPDHQGQGIGRRLVKRVLDVAADAGIARVHVEADPHAEAFYTRLGARKVGAKAAPMPGAPGRILPLLEFVIAH